MDHIYTMDVRQMLDFHMEKGADITVCGVPVPLQSCEKFGIIEMDDDTRITGFQEKPKVVKPMEGRPDAASTERVIDLITSTDLVWNTGPGSVVALSPEDESAWDLQDHFSLSFWDALIVGAAVRQLAGHAPQQ